jgi:hypothetical protein
MILIKNVGKIARIGLYLLYLAVIIEIGSYAFFRSYRDRFTFYDLSQFINDESQTKAAQKIFDQKLGWMNAGKRLSPRPPAVDFGRPILATFGDSFTFCAEVANNETYQTVLATLLKRDVMNYGFGAYGTDQALLLAREVLPTIKTPLASLGLITENISRLQSTYRPFYVHHTSLRLTKPRFTLSSGALVLQPNPIHSVDEVVKLQDPDFIAQLAQDDFWFNREVLPIFRFPYSGIFTHRSFWFEALSIVKGEKRADVNSRPWVDLWTDSNATELMFAIWDDFLRIAKAQGIKPFIILSPLESDLKRALKGDLNLRQQIIRAHCKSRGIKLFDGIEALGSVVKRENSYKRLFLKDHLSAEGNRAFAEALAKFIASEFPDGPQR